MESIALPMADILNSKICSGIFPDDLRITKVVPLYKSGDSSLFTNFRPIKAFERLIYNCLYSFLEKYNILFTSQYGVRKQSSTEHATLELIDSVVNALIDKYFAVAMFIDTEAKPLTLYITTFCLIHYGTMEVEGFTHTF